MPGWRYWSQLLQEELQQAREEGRDLEALKALESRVDATDAEGSAALFQEILDTPMRADFPFHEPDDLETIRSLRPARAPRLEVTAWSDDELLDKIHGAWLGRSVGCALGKPVEWYSWPYGDLELESWQRQREYLQAIDPGEWPLRDYFPAQSPASERTGALRCLPSTREHIAYMETDDDIRYTVLGQIVLMEKGGDFSSWDVANAWINYLPYRMVCTAETQAYRNMVDRYHFHPIQTDEDKVDWNWVATHQNPYREWIGAQIRADSYGYAAPGQPELAAEFAWRDARISHVKNGIYGAMLCAAMIAAAFATNDPREIVEAGLSQIPTTSRLYAEMRQTVAICEKYNHNFDHFEAVIEEIYALLGHYSPVHTSNNAALCVAGVLLGGGDFEKSITFAVMGGWDTDCNGATVGSIVGAIAGADRAPEHWVGRLNDHLLSGVIDYHPIAISECARRGLDIARRCGTAQTNV